MLITLLGSNGFDYPSYKAHKISKPQTAVPTATTGLSRGSTRSSARPLGESLKPEDFDVHHPGFFHDEKDRGRFESVDVWRDPEVYDDPSQPEGLLRPPMPSLGEFKSKGEYIKQPIVADYAKNSDKLFLMIKTGASVLWKRLPVHLFTTLTRVPHFGLYSDAPASIGGYEVIDVLANVSAETKNSDAFEMYRLQRELHDGYGVLDLSEVNVNKGWDLDRFKNIPMLVHAYKSSPNSDWFAFMDADSYFMLDNLMEYLDTLDPNKPLYIGNAIGAYRFCHGGTGVVLSRKALELTVGGDPEWIAKAEKVTHDTCCGDFMVAWLMKEMIDLEPKSGKEEYPHIGSKFQGNSFWDVEINEDKWCEPILSFHHLTPHDIEILWEFERLQGPNRNKITYASIYNQFYKPYLTPLREDWDNGAREDEYTEQRYQDQKANALEEGNEERLREMQELEKSGPLPHESLEGCRLACEAKSDCLSYRYMPEEKYCGISTTVRLGHPQRTYISHEDEHDGDRNKYGIVSGWQIDRIRGIRSRSPCDNFQSDDSLYVEGWYLTYGK